MCVRVGRETTWTPRQATAGGGSLFAGRPQRATTMGDKMVRVMGKRNLKGGEHRWPFEGPFWMVLLVSLASGCGSGGDSNPDPLVVARRHQITVVEGNYQSGFYGETLAPVRLQLVDPGGSPVAGAELQFSLQKQTGRSTADDVSLSALSAVTDEAGVVSLTLSLGQKSGSVLIDVRDAKGKALPRIVRAHSYHPADDAHRPLCVLEINDLHMRLLPQRTSRGYLGGVARIATIFKEIRRQNNLKGIPTLIVNSGDDFENTLFHNVPNAIPALYTIYDQIGVDIVQIGNHDYHFGIPFLDEQIALAQSEFRGKLQGEPMRFLMGNVDPSTFRDPYTVYASKFEVNFQDKENSARYNQTLVLDKGGIRIGLFGTVTDAAIYTQVAGDPPAYTLLGVPNPYSQGLRFIDPDPRKSDYVATAIDSLVDAGADIIINSSHAGLGFGDRVNVPSGKDEHVARHGIGAKSQRWVDLVLSAHSHVQLNHAIKVENPAGETTHIVQANEAGAFIGRVDYEVNTTTKRANLVDYHLVQVDESIEEDGEVKAKIDEVNLELVDLFGNVADEYLGDVGTNASARQRSQSGLGQVVGDAFVWGLNSKGVDCDISLVIPSIYRADLASGPFTSNDAYDIVPLHVLDDVGVNDEPLVILELRPGLFDYQLFLGKETEKKQVTALEFVVEAIHSLESSLESILPSGSSQVKIEVIQLAGMSYQLDATAPPFQRVVSSSIKVGGQPIDPSKTYRIAIVHSVGVNLAYVVNKLIQGYATGSDLPVSPLLVHEGKKPYFDSSILAWHTLRDYMRELLSNKLATGWEENFRVTGNRYRSVQPDLTLNPLDISWVPQKPERGDTVTVSLKLRNLGDVAIDSARVDLYYETTPWDYTDDDDGHAVDEGLSADFTGSLKLIASKRVAVAAYPETKTLDFEWTIPRELPRAGYPIVVRINDVKSAVLDPNTGLNYQESVTGNNAGPDQQRVMSIE